MFGLRAAIAIAASVAILLTILITVIVQRCYRFSKRGTKVTTEATTTTPPLPPPQNRSKTEVRQSGGISKIESRPRSNHPVFRRGSSTKPLFNWSDHPSLITDAVENGWSRFAFTAHVSSQSTRSTLLGCVGDLHHHHHHHNQQHHRDTQVEITWEVRENSLDFMQKIRLNSGLKKFSFSNSSSSSSMAMKSVIRTTLPLPGPPLGTTSSFPEEAYFEITILSVSSSSCRNEKCRIEGEKTKLIQDKGLEQKRNSDSIIHIATSKSTNHSLEEGERTALMMSVGLTSSSHVSLKIPGTYPASIGFNSDGSVYLDGIKLAFGSGKENWGQQKVIGCGFNPKQKKVFFTTDSVLTHMVNCKSDEFGSPLYPVIAANADVTILVNMGQSRFSYQPANFTRTPNPCFIGSILSTPTNTGYEDSEELFSMGRIDSGWLNHSTTMSSTNTDVYSWCSGAYNNNSSNNGKCKSKLNEEDDESEADLFEIVLDVNGKSPKV